MSNNTATTAPAPLVTDKGTVELLPEFRNNDSALLVHKWLTASRGHVFTSLEHVSRSGMARDVVVYASTGDLSHPLRWMSVPVADVLGRRVRQGKSGIYVQGCGMDMGYAIAYDLGRTLYGDGYALSHAWI